MRHNIGYLLLFLTQLHIQANGQPNDVVQYIFEVQAHTYMNTQHLRSNGNCCDGRGTCRDDCRNFFQFCLRLAGTNLQERSCPFGLLDFNVGSEDDDIVFSNGSSIINNAPVTNPLVFEGTPGQSWPTQGIQLLVAIFNDHDNDNDPNDVQLVDGIYIEQPNIQPTSGFSSSAFYSGFFQNTVQIQLSFRLRCQNSYLGDNCENLCIPQDNDSGHFACDGKGNVVCLPGYTDPETQCTKCIPAEGCDQGYCEQPGECKCFSGYTGELCETEIQAACESGELCLNGGSCVIETELERGYRCDCKGEFQGEKCEIIPSANTNANVNGNINSSIENSTKGPEDPTVAIGQGQRTDGQVAGIVIPILLVVSLLAVAGVVIAVVLYRYKCPHQKVLKSKQKEALENPTYDIVPPTGISLTSVVVRNTSQSNGHQTNGRPDLIQSMDTSDPLYASTEIDGVADGDYVYDVPEGTDYGPQPLTTNTLPILHSNRASFLRVYDQSCSRSMENLLEPPNLAGNAQSTPSKVNPYGDYGDKTLQRVASNYSLDDDENDTTGMCNGLSVFDNPDYEDVNLNVTTNAETNGVSAHSNDADYEDIYDKDNN